MLRVCYVSVLAISLLSPSTHLHPDSHGVEAVRATAAAVVVRDAGLHHAPDARLSPHAKARHKQVRVEPRDSAVALGITAYDIETWTRVSICEEGGRWNVIGPVFSGGLGITNHNWIAYGGLQFARNAAYATPVEQIAVAKRIQPYAPDAYGCGSW
jgi:hypothetical protein